MSQSVLADRYRIEARIGAGGMAEVFRGFDPVLNRTVAIKVLLPQFARDAAFVARFRREAQAAAHLNHPNIVAVYDTGSDDGTQYIVMEFIEGRTLHEFMNTGRKPTPTQAVELTQKVAMALAAAHAGGVIHRDVKPANIMVTRDGEVKLTDLGIARMETGETAPQTSAVLGTATYLSPEQAQGQRVDARTDIYSLGTVLYEMLTGRPPFTGDSPVAIAYKQVNETPVAPSRLNDQVSASLDAVVMKALAKNPANRYQTAKEFNDDLERVRHGKQVDATPILAGVGAAEATQVISRPQPTSVLPPQGEEPGSSRKSWVGVLIGLLIAALLAGGGYLLVTTLSNDSPEVGTVTVPDVRKKTFEEAQRALEDAGLVAVLGEPFVTDKQKPDTVWSQDPNPNDSVASGSEVTLQMVQAPPLVTVPSLIGQDQSTAETTLKDFNLTVGRVDEEASDQTPGTVISQTPAANEQVKPETPVSFVLSSGPADLLIPDVTCTPAGAAKAQLQNAGFTNVTISSERRTLPDTCPFNTVNVAEQDPVAGSTVSPDTPITLYPGVRASPSASPSETPSP
jgi:beta-lactam-binding protein with PASTA domain/predicted Ser/Thr protein kinase